MYILSLCAIERERKREMEGQTDRKEEKNREEGTKRGRAWKRDGG